MERTAYGRVVRGSPTRNGKVFGTAPLLLPTSSQLITHVSPSKQLTTKPHAKTGRTFTVMARSLPVMAVLGVLWERLLCSWTTMSLLSGHRALTRAG
eukprot:2726194-Rhodomonas_salina.1